MNMELTEYLNEYWIKSVLNVLNGVFLNLLIKSP